VVASEMHARGWIESISARNSIHHFRLLWPGDVDQDLRGFLAEASCGRPAGALAGDHAPFSHFFRK
jgi:hypothetical protein